MAGPGRKGNENQAFPNPGQMETCAVCARPQTAVINPLEAAGVGVVLEEPVEKEKKKLKKSFFFLFAFSVHARGPKYNDCSPPCTSPCSRGRTPGAASMQNPFSMYPRACDVAINDLSLSLPRSTAPSSLLEPAQPPSPLLSPCTGHQGASHILPRYLRGHKGPGHRCQAGHKGHGGHGEGGWWMLLAQCERGDEDVHRAASPRAPSGALCYSVMGG